MLAFNALAIRSMLYPLRQRRCTLSVVTSNLRFPPHVLEQRTCPLFFTLKSFPQLLHFRSSFGFSIRAHLLEQNFLAHLLEQNFLAFFPSCHGQNTLPQLGQLTKFLGFEYKPTHNGEQKRTNRCLLVNSVPHFSHVRLYRFLGCLRCAASQHFMEQYLRFLPVNSSPHQTHFMPVSLEGRSSRPQPSALSLPPGSAACP